MELQFPENFPYKPPRMHVAGTIGREVRLEYLEDEREWRATLRFAN